MNIVVLLFGNITAGTGHIVISKGTGKEFSITKVSFYCWIATSLPTLRRHYYRGRHICVFFRIKWDLFGNKWRVLRILEGIACESVRYFQTSVNGLKNRAYQAVFAALAENKNSLVRE